MLNRKEITAILVATLVLGFVISLLKSWEAFGYACLAVFLIILINTLAKKITSFYFDSEIEIGLWKIKRTGLAYFISIIPFTSPHPSRELKNPFPAGIFMPIITTAFTFGYIKWMASLVFDVKSKVYKAARRHGLYSFSEIPESQIGLIAAAGIIANLAFAIIGYVLGYPMFARLSIYFAFFNLLPISELDGNKIFFGSSTFMGFPLMWSFLELITLIGIGYAWFLI